MIGKPLRLCCIGRVKTSWWKDACQEYAKRISRYRKLEITELKDSSASAEKRAADEGQRLLEAAGPGACLVVLDERGRDLDSPAFAKLIQKLDESMRGQTTFVIGGPFGLDPKVREKATAMVRFGAMTFPHELARVLLLEQIYRAECILNNVPYHH